MKYSMCADIMFVAVGERGPIWPDTDGIIEAMELAAKNRLDAIEFFAFEGRDISRIESKSKELGVEIMAFCSKAGEFLGDPDRIDEVVEGFEQSIAPAKQLGCKMLILNGNEFSKDASRETVIAAMEEALKRIAVIAEKNGITAIVEPCTGGFFHNIAESAELLRRVNSGFVKLLYDIFHYQNMEGNITNSIKENLDIIGHIHGAGSPMRAELTVGEINYRYILQFLKEISYDKDFGLEFFTFQDRENKVAKSAELVHEFK